jgi:hypothetical protein
MLRTVMWLHYLYTAVALALIAAGLIMWRQSSPPTTLLTDTPPAHRSASGSSGRNTAE